MKQSPGLSPLVLSIVAAASLTASAETLSPPRGANVDPLAANCNIGPFPQTSKAGKYNQLCDIMQDSEKCLALVKDKFREVNGNVAVYPVTNLGEPRMQYCLDVLRTALLRDDGEQNDLAE